ncbi:MAG TPA: alpha/beta hydrolase-fold protein [Roseateles sp.]|uniref:alpha/beta hydrolase n=1 Tax=Roseateles sp. TaxID=1971397 RepID=UPI002EDADD09
MSRRLSLLLSLACLLSACGGGGSSSDGTPWVTQTPASAPGPAYVYAGTVERDKSIASRITGITYPYHVYLPEGYATSDKRYPVIYATDGQWTFPAFSQLLDKRRKPMILVNIEQGGPDRRAVDYTVNGAPAYGRFLREELVPLIESAYRTTGVRSFSGTSYGGLLGALMLSTEDVKAPFFTNYLLFDGSFWAMTARNIQDEEARFSASRRLPVRLILSSANAPGNVRDVILYEARYRGRAYEGLIIDRKDFNVAHNDVGDPSFDWAIDLID